MTSKLPLDTPPEVLDLARQIHKHLGGVISGRPYTVTITRNRITLQGTGWPDDNPEPTHGDFDFDRITVEAGGAFFTHERARQR